jgi:acyl-CoA synthetase (NDP forming)
MMEGRLCRSPLRTPSETVPVYEFPETPAKVLAKCVRYAEWIAETPGRVPEYKDIDVDSARRIIDAALAERGPCWLRPEETSALLEAFRVPRTGSAVTSTSSEAVAAAERIGFPVVLKLVSATITHKTEIGGVRLHLKDAAAVRGAFEGIRERLAAEGKLDQMQGVLVQPMITGGVELMVGVTSDRLFGPLVAFGLGGIHVELLGDVRFRITPLTDKDAHAMVREIRGYRLLEGYRGHAPADIPAVEDLLLRVSRMVDELPAIAELDLNPVVALPPGRGCAVLDARIWVTS